MPQGHKEFNHTLFSPTNIIAIYTVLSILLKLRSHLGLEAMLEYIENYLRVLEANNPQMKYAVAKALEYIDVKKIYTEAFDENEK